MEKELSAIQCYKCWEMVHYSKECLNLPSLFIVENMGFYIRRFFVEEKEKICVHLIALMNKGRKKTSKFLKMWLMSWPKLNDWWKTLLILMQTSRGWRRWWRPQQRRRIIEGKGLDSKTFQFLKILVIIWWWRMWDHKMHTSPLDNWW
jgi:hypothetical protein